MIRRAALLLFLGMILYSPALHADVRFFSSKKVSRVPHGSLLRSPAVSALYVYAADADRHFMAYDFGAKIPGVSIRGGPLEADIGGAGGVFTRFQLFSESFNFVHADFTGALYADLKYRDFLFETTVYHTSSHLGDDYIRYDGGRVRNTGWEAVRQYVSYVLPMCDASLGAEYKFSRRPGDVIFYPLSFFLGGRVDLLSAGVPFFMEMEIEMIAGPYPPNIGVRIGVYLKYILNVLILAHQPDGYEPHEFTVHWYYGYSRMGSFYNRREMLLLCGPSFRY